LNVGTGNTGGKIPKKTWLKVFAVMISPLPDQSVRAISRLPHWDIEYPDPPHSYSVGSEWLQNRSGFPLIGFSVLFEANNKIWSGQCSWIDKKIFDSGHSVPIP
jgi:hypothetical protein